VGAYAGAPRRHAGRLRPDGLRSIEWLRSGALDAARGHVLALILLLALAPSPTPSPPARSEPAGPGRGRHQDRDRHARPGSNSVTPGVRVIPVELKDISINLRNARIAVEEQALLPAPRRRLGPCHQGRPSSTSSRAGRSKAPARITEQLARCHPAITEEVDLRSCARQCSPAPWSRSTAKTTS